MHKRVSTSPLTWTGLYYVGDMTLVLVPDSKDALDTEDQPTLD